MKSQGKRVRLAQAAQAAITSTEDESSQVVEASMPALADEIRASVLDQSYAHRRSAFIDSKLRQMSEAELVRFEFFIRSHLNRHGIKKILQQEVDKVRMFIIFLRALLDGQTNQHLSQIVAQQRLLEQSETPSPAPPNPVTVTNDMAIVVGGLSKLLIGEIVTAARAVSQIDPSDPTYPNHKKQRLGLREIERATQQLESESMHSKSSGFLFSRMDSLFGGAVEGSLYFDELLPLPVQASVPVEEGDLLAAMSERCRNELIEGGYRG